MKLCALNREDLDHLFASVSSSKASSADLTGSFSSLSLTTSTTSGLASSKYAPPTTTSSSTTTSTTPDPPTIPQTASTRSIEELASVLAALRKLREAITASNRTDAFARRAYYFNIHVAILCHDWESYVPALHSLLNTIHPQSPLPAHDLKDFVGLMILDQCCRQADYAGARATKVRFKYTDRRVECVLRALVADDWVAFWRMRRAVDGYQRSVMEFAEGRVRVHALKCIRRAYMRADKRFVERSADREWGDLVGEGVGWELVEGDRVVIQKPKGR